jgi:hypothetical protein
MIELPYGKVILGNIAVAKMASSISSRLVAVVARITETRIDIATHPLAQCADGSGATQRPGGLG